MSSGDWLKSIIGSKKSRSKQIKGASGSENSKVAKQKNHSKKKTSKSRATNGKFGFFIPLTEDIAATRIQTAYRAYKARKSIRRMKGIVRLQVLTQRSSVTKQASTTLSHLNTWHKIQCDIRARRHSMVTEGRIKQKKLENQIKFEEKLQGLEVDWCGGAETKEETVARLHYREEAAVKRERTLAYAFSHQWRANSNPGFGPHDFGKAEWDWSWIERWIAARPWENRVILQNSPKKLPNKLGKKSSTPPAKKSLSMKIVSPNGKGTFKTRRLSYPGTERPTSQSSIKIEMKNEMQNGLHKRI